MHRYLLSFWVATPLLVTAISTSAQTNLPSIETQTRTAVAGQRNFPSNAQLGVLRISEVPNATIHGQAIRTAPGFRLFITDNKLIFAHSVYQQDLQVVFVKESSTGWLQTAWILSPEEITALSKKR